MVPRVRGRLLSGVGLPRSQPSSPASDDPTAGRTGARSCSATARIRSAQHDDPLRAAAPSRVTLEVFDVQGRVVRRRPLGVQAAGAQRAAFDGGGSATGRLPLPAAARRSGRPARPRPTLPGKMMLAEVSAGVGGGGRLVPASARPVASETERARAGGASRVAMLAACAALRSRWPRRPARAPAPPASIAGRVLDQKKQPLVGADRRRSSAARARRAHRRRRAASPSSTSRPAPTSVQVSLLGYSAVAIAERRRLGRPDHAARRRRSSEAPVELAGGRGQRASGRWSTSNLTSTHGDASTREEIEKLPVQELQDVVNLQAGVVDGHFRGGRIGEVQYQVDGVSVNNAYDNTSTPAARPLAARGSAGDQRHVRRRVRPGDERRRQRGAAGAAPSGSSGTREAFAGGFVYPARRIAGPAHVDDYRSSPARSRTTRSRVSGPTGLPKTTFLRQRAALRRSTTTSTATRALRARPTRRLREQDRPPDRRRRAACRSATRASGPGCAKITQPLARPTSSSSYQAMFERIDGRSGRTDAYRLESRRPARSSRRARSCTASTGRTRCRRDDVLQR